MPITVIATGRVAEEPIRLFGEDPCVVFVLDPFPGSAGIGVAHACEVACRGQDLSGQVLERLRLGDRAEVSGELVMDTVDGPIEDDLSAVRVWIKASAVSVLEWDGREPP